MSLLSNAMEDFVIINKSVVDDGLGGYRTEWIEGATIQCAVSFETSPELSIAEALGSKSVYKIIVRKSIQLDYHDVLKRKSNGLYYRITNNADDYATPSTAMLDMRVYTAEEWRLA